MSYSSGGTEGASSGYGVVHSNRHRQIERDWDRWSHRQTDSDRQSDRGRETERDSQRETDGERERSNKRQG